MSGVKIYNLPHTIHGITVLEHIKNHGFFKFILYVGLLKNDMFLRVIKSYLPD